MWEGAGDSVPRSGAVSRLFSECQPGRAGPLPGQAAARPHYWPGSTASPPHRRCTVMSPHLPGCALQAAVHLIEAGDYTCRLGALVASACSSGTYWQRVTHSTLQ